MKATPHDIRFVSEGLDHPEGIALGPDGRIYAGSECGSMYRIDIAQGTCETIAETGGFVLGVTLDANSRVYACDVGRRKVVRCDPDGEVQAYATGTKGRPLVNPNYAVFDAEGRLFFSDSGDYWEPSGSLWVIEPGEAACPLTPAHLPFANGLCLDTEEGYLYVALSTAAQVVRYRVDAGALAGEMETVATLPAGTVPDGIALDTSRNIWLACYVPDEIWKISPEGGIEKIMEDPTGELLNRPTNLALAQDRVYYANLGGWHIGAFEVAVEPLPLHYPVF